MTKPVGRCRICGFSDLSLVVDLGRQAFTGIFPSPNDPAVESVPLRLVWCPECTLLQLGEDYDLSIMYGENYGYRSGLNPSMVAHLRNKAHKLTSFVASDKASILDIGSNDGTLLSFFQDGSSRLIGVDPSAAKFQRYYPRGVELYTEFFGQDFLACRDLRNQLDLITSVSMFYDLPDPASFVKSIASCLTETGIWHLEQSYLPLMLETNSFDTICHEHLEYYSLKVIEDLLMKNGLEIFDVELNRVNGGSIGITCGRSGVHQKNNAEVLDWLRKSEMILELSTIAPYREFAKRAEKMRTQLSDLVDSIRRSGKNVAGFGASTKGNVTLQYAGLDSTKIDVIYEVNQDKFGRSTPGTMIPIVSEDRLLSDQPDYLLILPWHFRDHVIRSCDEYLSRGGALIFPMPFLEIFTR